MPDHNNPTAKSRTTREDIAAAAPTPEGSGSHPSWSQWLEDTIWGKPEDKTAGARAFFQRWLQIFDRALRGFISHDGPASASALTYTTILTIVPLLAILLAVLKGFGMHEMARKSLEQLPFVQETRIDVGPRGKEKFIGTQPGQRPMVPSTPAKAPERPGAGGVPERDMAAAAMDEESPGVLTGGDIVNKIYQFVENTDVSNLGVIGVIGLLWAVFSLLSKIEKTMNEAWAVRRARPWSRRISDYLNMLVISILLLAALSATATGSVIPYTGMYAESFNEVQRRLLKLLPYIIVWVAFVLMYYYMPNTRVRWKSALVSGLIAGTIFQLAQVLFIRSQMLAGRYKIYGAFAVILLLLVWMFLAWCIVLWGAEVCSAHQNLRDWRRRRRVWRGTPVERETLALRMAALLAAPLLDQAVHKRMDAGDLADVLMLPPDPVGEMIELFQAQGLIVQSADDGAYLFARSPENVSLLDLLRLVRQGSLTPARNSHGLMEIISREIAEPLGSMTLKDLIALPVDDIKSFTF